jgi:carboxymethylenebutenolidase
VHTSHKKTRIVVVSVFLCLSANQQINMALFGLFRLDLSFLPFFMRILGRLMALVCLIFPASKFTNVEYTNDQGETLLAYLATPPNYSPDATYPAALVLHAWNGMSEEPVYFANLLAEQGYIVLAPDLFRGVASKELNIPWNILTVTNAPQDRMDKDVDAALEYLLSLNVDEARVFSGPGFCFGGAQALEASKRRAFAATVTLYGSSIDGLQDPDSSNWGLIGVDGAKVLGIYGSKDRSPSVAEAKGFETAMVDRGIDHVVTIYEGVGHAFVNPDAHEAGRQQARPAWDQVVSFMNDVAGGSGTSRHALELGTIPRSQEESHPSMAWKVDHTMDLFRHSGHFHNHQHR